MRAIHLPTHNPREVFLTCANSVQSPDLQDRLHEITVPIVDAANEFHQRSLSGELFMIEENTCKNAEVVLGSVTKEELKGLYDNQLVVKNKPGRLFYDLLMVGSPYGKCPYCGLGQASTLDHYLPKSTYPQFSVLPFNLVPACKDCNTGKSTFSASRAEDQCLHPYYDHGVFIYDKWLFAEAMQTSPVTIRFFIKAPDNWNQKSKERLDFHFKDFKLATRYSIEAATEIANLKGYLSAMPSPTLDLIKEHLRMRASAYSNVFLNSWQAAMYMALHDSDWYCAGGYQ